MLCVRLCGVELVSTAERADSDDRCLTCFVTRGVFGAGAPVASLVREGDLARPSVPRIDGGLRSVGVAGVPGVGGVRPAGVAGVLRPAVLLVLGRGRDERTFGFGLGRPEVVCPGEGDCPGEREEGLMVVRSSQRSAMRDPSDSRFCRKSGR